MSNHYDRLETRTPAVRESALFRDLRHVLAVARSRVPSLRLQLKGIDVASLQSRPQLAAIPMLTAAEIVALQNDHPPLGALTATRIASLRQLFLSNGTQSAVEGQAKDWWGAGRALFAAGLRKGQVVLNCFAYDLVPDGHMIASGAAAIGAPLIPGGRAPLDTKLEIVRRHRPVFYCGSAAHLKELLDRGIDTNSDMSCLRHALVTGPTSMGLRNEFRLRGIVVRQMTMRPEVGVIAYECGSTDGMTVNEGLIVEIVDPLSALPVRDGDEGELVVTRINADYPLVRLATGEISAVMRHGSSCGRTNMRIRAPRPATTLEKPQLGSIHLSEIKSHHPTLGRMRLYIRSPRGDDVLHLKAEHLGGREVAERVSETLHLVTRLRGTVELVEPGTLSDDEGPVVDERCLN